MCVGSSPRIKKCVASFLVPLYRQGPGARRAPGSFLIYKEGPRDKVAIFFSPSLQVRSGDNRRSGPAFSMGYTALAAVYSRVRGGFAGTRRVRMRTRYSAGIAQLRR